VEPAAAVARCKSLFPVFRQSGRPTTGDVVVVTGGEHKGKVAKIRGDDKDNSPYQLEGLSGFFGCTDGRNPVEHVAIDTLSSPPAVALQHVKWQTVLQMVGDILENAGDVAELGAFSRAFTGGAASFVLGSGARVGGLVGLAPLLKHNSVLTSLDLSGAEPAYGDDLRGLVALGEALASPGTASALAKLTVQVVRLDVGGLATAEALDWSGKVIGHLDWAFAAGVVRGSTALRRLDLSRNADAFKTSAAGLDAVCESLKHSDSVREVVFSGIGLAGGEGGARVAAVVGMLGANTRIETLALADNGLEWLAEGSDVATVLCALAEGCPALHTLDLSVPLPASFTASASDRLTTGDWVEVTGGQLKGSVAMITGDNKHHGSYALDALHNTVFDETQFGCADGRNPVKRVPRPVAVLHPSVATRIQQFMDHT
jgi:hypothetical protein